jgi:probable addiction module antidote protein
MDDGGDGIIKGQPVAAGQLDQGLGHGLGGERPGGQDNRGPASGWEFCEFLPDNLHQGVLFQLLGDGLGEVFAVDRQGSPGGNRRFRSKRGQVNFKSTKIKSGQGHQDGLSPCTESFGVVNIMSKTLTSRYDVAEHLRTPEEMAAYLEACLEEADGDAAFVAKALGDIARAKGMSQVARDAGLSRESLYKALSGERSPGFDTILKVIGALGLKLHAEASHT